MLINKIIVMKSLNFILRRQVVILGAGFDCKAYYLDSLKECKLFELDSDMVFGVKN